MPVRYDRSRQVSSANAAREDKYNRLMALKAQEADASTTNARANVMSSQAAISNADTNAVNAAEGTRHNIATERATRQGLAQEATRDKNTLSLGTEKNAIDRLGVNNAFKLGQEKNAIDRTQADSQSRLQAQQGIAYGAMAKEDSAKAGLVEQERSLGQEFVDPKTTAERRAQIGSYWSAKNSTGGRAGAGLKVIPGQKYNTKDGETIVERISPDTVVDPSTGISRVIVPDNAILAAKQKIEMYRDNPQLKAAAEAELQQLYDNQLKASQGLK